MDKCSVCLENDQSDCITVKYQPCGHWNCLTCYIELESKCPMCRSQIIGIHYEADTQIFVRDLNGRTSTLCVNLNSTRIDELIYMLTHKWNLQHGIRLIANCRTMYDKTKTLADYDVHAASTLHAVASCYAKLPRKKETKQYGSTLNVLNAMH